MLATSENCEYCHNRIPRSAVRCPHCALPGLFPNVRAAGAPEERVALQARYQGAMALAAELGCEHVLRDFEAALSKSVAVIARPLTEVQRLATSENELYATFYQLTESGVRTPTGSKWDSLREVTDNALFSGYKRDIRFGALSLDGRGLSNYGECSLVLKDDMIAHRASVFQENSVTFMDRHDIRMSEADELPKGYRATWGDRGKLCAIKIAERVGADVDPSQYPTLLIQEGQTSKDDNFVEVHIWGPMTARTLERVIVSESAARSGRAILGALRERLDRLGVGIEVV